jgi:glycosyltransferase involved in cell wall biosynthesis
LVSVILPCYNCSKYIEEAILSIINQTYKNLEIIITDDCSTDNSLQIIENLAKIDNRIIVIKNRENLKLIKTLNNMIDMAHGKYIARMDGDDISLPERIEKQTAFMESHPKYAVCGTNAWHINSKGYIIGKSNLPSGSKEIEQSKFCLCPFYHSSVIIKTNIIKQRKYNAKFVHTEDYELWLSVLRENKGINLTEKLLKYRKHHESITFSHKAAIEKSLAMIFSEYLTDHNLPLSEKYVSGFFLVNKKSIKDDSLHNLILNKFNEVENIKGFNYHLALKYFFYLFKTRKLLSYFRHFNLYDNIKFLCMLPCYTLIKLFRK